MVSNDAAQLGVGTRMLEKHCAHRGHLGIDVATDHSEGGHFRRRVSDFVDHQELDESFECRLLEFGAPREHHARLVTRRTHLGEKRLCALGHDLAEAPERLLRVVAEWPTSNDLFVSLHGVDTAPHHVQRAGPPVLRATGHAFFLPVATTLDQLVEALECRLVAPGTELEPCELEEGPRPHVAIGILGRNRGQARPPCDIPAALELGECRSIARVVRQSMSRRLRLEHHWGTAGPLARLKESAALLVARLAPNRAALVEMPDQLAEETLGFSIALRIVEQLCLAEGLLHARRDLRAGLRERRCLVDPNRELCVRVAVRGARLDAAGSSASSPLVRQGACDLRSRRRILLFE